MPKRGLCDCSHQEAPSDKSAKGGTTYVELEAGGCDAQDIPLDDLWQFELRANRWRTLLVASAARQCARYAACVPRDRIG